MGNLKRPLRYRQGQRRAIDLLGFPEMDKSLSILDVGCGIGTGMLHFRELGFDIVIGIEKDECRAKMARRRGLDVLNEDVSRYYSLLPFDVLWSSHSFEHFENPEHILHLINGVVSDNALLFFILPYPDLNPSELHVASKEIGLNIDDDGKTLIQWFEDRGLELLYSKRDDFREPEIWLKFRKK